MAGQYLLGEPSAAEQHVFELLASGISRAAGALDGLELAQLAKNVLLLKNAQERVARAGALIRTERVVLIPNPDIRAVSQLSTAVHRGLAARGPSPLLLDRSPKGNVVKLKIPKAPK